MLNRVTLVNITVFMDRAQCTGKEALGWAETYQAVIAEINAFDAAQQAAAKALVPPDAPSVQP